MIIYFANRRMEVLGQASTGLPRGFFASDDKKIEDVDTGVASFECTVSFEKSEQRQLQEVVKAGNYGAMAMKRNFILSLIRNWILMIRKSTCTLKMQGWIC